MSNLTIFQFKDQEVKVKVIDEKPWFLGSSICHVLEIKNYSDSYSRLKSYEKTIGNAEGVDNPDAVWISESGLYRLVLTSRKPQAEPFQDWVVQEVLPTIRKTGSYSIKPLTPGELLKLQADAIIAIEKQMVETQQEVREIKNYLEDADNLARMFIAKGELEVPSELTLATKINMVVRSYCNQTDSDYKLVWRDIYREFKLREHVDIITRYNNALSRGDIGKSMSKLNYVVNKLNLGERLYSVVIACCIQGRWSSVASIVDVM